MLLIFGGNFQVRQHYTGSILKINSVRMEDRGTYYCVADNGASMDDRRSINLQVELAPVVTIPYLLRLQGRQ